MSYILEALKKAQAERQLGATPTIHAPTLDVAATRGAGRRPWQPVALAVAGVAVAGLLALLWRQQSAAPGTAAVPAVAVAAGAPAAQPSSAPVVQPAMAPAAGHGDVTAPGLAPSAARDDGAATVAQRAQDAPAAAKRGAAPAGQGANDAPSAPPLEAAPSAQRANDAPSAPPREAAASSRRANDQGPAAAREAAPVALAAESRSAKPGKPAAPSGPEVAMADPVGKPALAAKPEPASARPKSKPAPAVDEAEETAQLLRELPEPIQRIVPPVTMSGYMYSRNPADRLVLIDKVLRREGEEVAPGLVLEKLQAKAAVFSFKGYRYRVPY
ncbi:general secretion pathway protein GspB [Pseudoduganella namucuonensis]|uniref:General secretion pathway protein B n=1 Tax=Pseudoduganella namucuonensis TaxID=1035707 RepID=A0A1I7I776_9BURK|nr:general secretion pathway protein GspB [Pseudoduganella namucuonensis]SFU68626.1 general secretion pathway protein B [Pseudoduganella namucuonensis]